MRGFESNRRHYASVKGPFPRFHTNAPAVARLKARKAVFGARRDQVITDGSLVAQEFVIHNHTDRMLTGIIRTGVALTVTIETCNGIGTTSLKDGSQNVFNHTMSGYRGGNAVRLRPRRDILAAYRFAQEGDFR